MHPYVNRIYERIVYKRICRNYLFGRGPSIRRSPCPSTWPRSCPTCPSIRPSIGLCPKCRVEWKKRRNPWVVFFSPFMKLRRTYTHTSAMFVFLSIIRWRQFRFSEQNFCEYCRRRGPKQCSHDADPWILSHRCRFFTCPPPNTVICGSEPAMFTSNFVSLTLAKDSILFHFLAVGTPFTAGNMCWPPNSDPRSEQHRGRCILRPCLSCQLQNAPTNDSHAT